MHTKHRGFLIVERISTYPSLMGSAINSHAVHMYPDQGRAADLFTRSQTITHTQSYAMPPSDRQHVQHIAGHIGELRALPNALDSAP